MRASSFATAGDDTVGLEATLREVRGQIAELEAAGNVGAPLYVRLVDRERQLESLAALRISNVSMVESARAADAEQVAPRPRRNTALALVAGLVVGLILVALWETLSTRPRTEQEIEALLGMPFLARLKSGRRLSPLLLRQLPSDRTRMLSTHFASTSSSQAVRRGLARS